MLSTHRIHPITAIIIAGLIALLSAPAMASVDQFVGTWTNTNSSTRGVTKIIVSRNGGQLRMQTFGSCSPSDCDWGTVRAHPYAANVSSNVENNALAVSATYNQDFATKTVLVRPQGSKVKATILTHYKDGSGRTNTLREETFTRQLGLIPGIIASIAPQQDCITFNNSAIQVKKVGSSWKIVDGSMYLKDFGNNQAEANLAFATMKSNGFNQQCFVGRPGPSFEYYLKNNAATGSALPGADCISFNNGNLKTKKISGSWKIVDGSHWLMDFGGKKQEAKDSLSIIKYHGFTKSCFVGRPDPSMTYMVK